jgi:hypothetical protein
MMQMEIALNSKEFKNQEEHVLIMHHSDSESDRVLLSGRQTPKNGDYVSFNKVQHLNLAAEL